MKFLFKVIDIMHMPKIGLLITGDGPPCDTVNKDYVKKSIGSKVLIKSPSGKSEIYEVKSKDAGYPCFSSDPHWAMFISLGFDAKIDSIERGSLVYTLED